jgi:hypothetical protein
LCFLGKIENPYLAYDDGVGVTLGVGVTVIVGVTLGVGVTDVVVFHQKISGST